MNCALQQNRFLLFAVLLLAACASPSASSTPAPSAQTTIENKGSDTMVNLALAWAEAYEAAHPETQLSVTGGGSGTGIAALINGTVTIANASRAIKDEERQQAEANGIEAVEFVVAKDAIAIVVNPANPVNRLSLPQLSAIYSGQITNWREVGGDDRPIVLLSRESNSGTHVYFLENVLRLGKKENKTLFSPDTGVRPRSTEDCGRVGVCAGQVMEPQITWLGALRVLVESCQSSFCLFNRIKPGKGQYAAAQS
ncbi:MAG: PstS family phosphate ABC transporter substrate-binding protein [Chloroflexi bacterium]|nr:PstS family phosphate ABC transporter substrate-binding protein [Chloroflexota bacterium]